MRISDWSSDVCSSDLPEIVEDGRARRRDEGNVEQIGLAEPEQQRRHRQHRDRQHERPAERLERLQREPHAASSINDRLSARTAPASGARSEEHTSELQSLMRISYAVFCLKKKI